MPSSEQPLADVYWDVMMDEPVDLEPFVQRVAAGEWGSYTAAAITEFLRQIERDILGSIATKAATTALGPDVVEERSQETHRSIEDLIRRYAAAE